MAPYFDEVAHLDEDKRYESGIKTSKIDRKSSKKVRKGPLTPKKNLINDLKLLSPGASSVTAVEMDLESKEVDDLDFYESEDDSDKELELIRSLMTVWKSGNEVETAKLEKKLMCKEK